MPDDVGGRYSVLTAVGLLPIAVAGADIDALDGGRQKGAGGVQQSESRGERLLQVRGDPQYPLQQGQEHRDHGQLRALLHADERVVEAALRRERGQGRQGPVPGIRRFSTDLHSMGQYIQDGRRDLFETVVLFEKPKHEIVIGNDPANVDGLNFLEGRSMAYINRKAFEGTVLAHNDGGVPNIVLNAPDFSEDTLGQLIYFFERACAISATCSA